MHVNLLLSAVITEIKMWVFLFYCGWIWLKKEFKISTLQKKSICIHRIIEYPKLKGTHKGHGAQPLAPHNTIQNSNPMVWEHCPNTPWALAGWGSDHCSGQLLHAHCPLGKNVSPAHPLDPPLTQLHSVPLGPVTVIRERRSTLPLCPMWGAVGHHEASPEPPL